MDYTIKKGDRFLCLADYVMYDGRIAYTKGKIYVSEFDNHITDNNPDWEHEMSGEEDFFDYFKLVPNTKDNKDTDENEAINFATWYSGMSKDKVITAYEKYLSESLKQQP